MQRRALPVPGDGVTALPLPRRSTPAPLRGRKADEIRYVSYAEFVAMHELKM